MSRFRRLFVLGGSSGIGLAVARLATDGGFAVQVTASSDASAERASSALGGRAVVHVVDMRTIADHALRDLTSETDALVLTSGVEYVGPAQHEPPGALRDMLAVNVTGPIVAVSGCLPHMAERRRGVIVGLGSVAARDARPFLAGYSASKAALESYLRSLREEVRPLGVAVEVLSPGPVTTDLGAKGPANWTPEASSEYFAGYREARERASAERDRLSRKPDDVARDVMHFVHG